jgi:hypothetical protein
MHAKTNIQEASFLHDYAISFDILVSHPPLVLFLVVFLYQYLSLYPSAKHPTMVTDTSFQLPLLSLSSSLNTHISLPYCEGGFTIALQYTATKSQISTGLCCNGTCVMEDA